mgnify:CR=1 FL=1
MKTVKVGNVSFSNELPFALIAGPCQMESAAHSFEMVSGIDEICKKLGIGYVFKASFDKANRTSINGKRGIGLDKALQVFADVKAKYGCPVVTDVHEPYYSQSRGNASLWLKWWICCKSLHFCVVRRI